MDHGMLWSIIIFLGIYVLIAFELMEESLAAILGACLVMGLGLISFDEAVHAVDMNVIFLLIGMMTSVALLAETGFFEFIAIWIAKKAKGRAAPIVVMLMLTTMLFSALLDNVTTIILLTPVTILICQLLELRAAPILIMEALASNIGGTATLIGDPPNIIIGSKASLSFLDFLNYLTPAVLIMTICFIGFVLFILRGKLAVAPMVRQRVLQAYPCEAIVSRSKMYKALFCFGLMFVGFFLHAQLHLEAGVIALAGMTLMLLLCKTKSETMLKSVEWDAILFFIGLFIIVAALKENGVISYIAKYMIQLCGDNLLLAMTIILVGSALFSTLLNNIPFMIVMIPMVQELIVSMDPTFSGISGTAVTGPHVLFWALTLGACLGGNGTIIGASANVVAVKIADRNGYKIGFLDFMKLGIPVMLGTVAIAWVYLWLRFF